MSSEKIKRSGSGPGTVVRPQPHPNSFIDADEGEFLAWAKTVTRPKAMDLFCGAGGLSLGIQSAGFDVIVGVDHDQQALETHRANFPGLSVNWDLSDECVIDHVIDLGNNVGVELVAGGPPCQPFSKAGRSIIRELVRKGRRNATDQRRDLWESFVAVVDGIRPSAVLMENVPDMALDRDMQIIRTMVDLLETMNYSVSVRVMDASRYEVPQFRQRLILVALKNRTKFSWPQESGYQVTLRTAIGDLPSVTGGWKLHERSNGSMPYRGPISDFQKKARSGVSTEYRNRIFDHVTRPVRSDDQIIFSAMDSQTKYSEIDSAVLALNRVIEEPTGVSESSLKRYRDDIFDDKYKRLDWDRLSRTITAHIAKDGYSYIHPEQDRTLTIREAARIQTFPDQFRFAGPPSAALKQIGNAVPPQLGEYLGTSILMSLENHEEAGPSTQKTSQQLAAWFQLRDKNGQLRFPWLSTQEHGQSVRSLRWRTIQAEILLGRTRENVAKTIWPILKDMQTPARTLAGQERILELSGWIDKSDSATKLLAIASVFRGDPKRLDSITGMKSVPNLSESVAVIAMHVAPGPDEDPVTTTSGALRVAARYFNIPVDRRNSETDGRIALARLLGAEDRTSDNAFLAIIEIAETICLPSKPRCGECPLNEECLASN